MYQAIILLWIANTLVNKYLPLLGGRGVVCDRVVNFRHDDIDLVGQLVNIQINEALPNSLRGELGN